MKQLLLFTGILFASVGHGQFVADFENLDIGIDTFDNDGNADKGYQSGDIFFPNTYDPTFGSWTDWAISTKTDTITEGFMNPYSSFSGSGKASQTYAVASAFEPVRFMLTEESEGKTVNGIYITNNTYAALSMTNGDGFGKRFGGESGNDPDFFKLTIKKWLNGEISTDSIDFYLADYRFEDNTQDYLVKDWTYVDLEDLGGVDSLEFSLSSSDVGAFGMNTPAFFCIDNVLVEMESSNDEALESDKILVFPNPASDVLYFKGGHDTHLKGVIYDNFGRVVMMVNVRNGQIDIHHLDSGTYYLELGNEKRIKRFVKL